jgi:hypothetical protein
MAGASTPAGGHAAMGASRRAVTFADMFFVLKELGYCKQQTFALLRPRAGRQALRSASSRRVESLQRM